jgi:O-antigen/teichoic acid export membrane protein
MSKNLASGIGLVSAANMLGGTLNLVMVVALTRLLPKSEFAAMALIYMLFTIFSTVGTLGLPSALLFYVPKFSASASRHLGLWMGGFLTLIAIPVALIFVIIGPLLAQHFPIPNIHTLFYIVALALVFDFPGQTFSGYLLAKERYIGTSIVTGLFVTTRFIGFTLPAYLGLGVHGMVWGLCLTTALRSITYFLYLAFIERGELTQETRASWRTKDLFSYGIPLSLSNIVGRLNLQADKYMIAVLTSAEIYAIYHVGALEVPLVATLAYSVTRALMPSLVNAHDQQRPDQFIHLWHTSVVKVSTIILPVFAFLMCFTDPLITLIFSAEYHQASVPFRVYLCLLPLRLCSYGAILRAMGATKPVLTSSVISLLVNLVLNYPLYLWLGLSGPATASVIAQFVAIFFLLSMIRQRLQITWRNVFPFRQILTGLSVAIVSVYLCDLCINQASRFEALQFLTPSSTLTIGLMIYLMFYIPIAWRMGFISTQDLNTLWGWISLKSLRNKVTA